MYVCSAVGGGADVHLNVRIEIEFECGIGGTTIAATLLTAKSMRACVPELVPAEFVHAVM